jgi:RHS repeat-associated protein
VNVAQELSGGSVTANLLSGGIDEVFTRTDSSGTANFLTDGLGSTLTVTNSSGSSLVQYAYEPFGNTTITSGSSTNSYQYTGRENDGTGLYFYRARYYSPALQRFVSEDPIGSHGGINFYAYAGNDPVSYVDPQGKDPIIGVAVGAIAGGIYGGMGAYLAGGNAKDIAIAAGIGAASGGLIGTLDPSLGVGTLALIGAASGGAGDVLGQVIAQASQGKPIDINPGSTLGAIAGGALGGAGGASLGASAIALGLPELPATAGIAAVTSGPGVFLPAIGANLWPSGETNTPNGKPSTAGRKSK